MVQIYPIPRSPISLIQTPPFRPLHPSRVHVRSDCLSRPTLALRDSDDWWAVAALKPGAEAFVGLFAGDEHPTRYTHPFSSFPFMLCEAEHRNPNLKLFSYLI